MDVRQLRILIVDDDEDDVLLLKESIREGMTGVDLHLDGALSAREALSCLEQAWYDVLLFDYRLGREDGLQLLREIRVKAIETPVIMLTGQDGEAAAVEAMKAGATDYLARSRLSSDLLGTAIRHAVALHEGEGRRRQAEAALRESEERFRSAFEEAAIGMALRAPDGRLLRVNRAFCRMLGYSEQELLALRADDLIDPDDRAMEASYTRHMLAGEIGAYHRERRYLHKLGHVVWVLAGVSLVRAGDGRPLYFIVQAQDVTERKQAEAAREQLEARLRQAQKMEAFGQLAAGVAHDFNNLLTVIQGRCVLLRRRLGPDDPLRRHVDLVAETADQAAALTRQILAFGRKASLQPMVLDLGAVVATMEAMLRRLVGESIELVTVLGPGLGRVKADRRQIEQIILNLVVNARDAMPLGGKLTVETANADVDEREARTHSPMLPGPYVLLAISDTGHGMDSETQAQVFDPFFTTKEPGKGTGLGLATVYGFVKQSGGNVWVSSEPGIGATFQVYLPRVEDTAEPVEAGEVVAEVPRGSETVLLVEDAEAVRKLARESLELSGYIVLEVRYPGEALQACDQHAGPIHLMVTDVVMPQMSGVELSQRLARHRPDMKVLYVSGHPVGTIVDAGALDQGKAFLQKPFTPDELARKVREVLDAPREASP